jgi:tRNA modification GTPase
LSDTAGVRDTNDKVESIGIERAKAAAESAELILAVFDGSRKTDEEDASFVEYVKALDGIKIAIINKSDLGVSNDVTHLVSGFDYSIFLSANSGDGFDRLVSLVENIYIDRDLDMGKSAIIANARQNAAVHSSAENLRSAISAIRADLPLEICCVEVENALAALGELDGRTVSEDIISKIFANFCVGK